MTMRWRSFWMCSVLIMAGCAMMAPSVPDEPVRPLPLGVFDYQDWDAILRDFVHEDGQVDYGALARNPQDLNRFIVLLAAYSPESSPNYFKTPNDALAYWINAYNACVLRALRDKYPVTHISKVKGFYNGIKHTLGKKPYTLDDIKHVIETRFKDPRAYFALADGRKGAPKLIQTVYTGKNLNLQLGKVSKAFLRNRTNIYIQNKKLFLSSFIRDIQESIFASQRAKGVSNPTMVDFIGKSVKFPRPVKDDDIVYFEADDSITDTPLFTDQKFQLPY